MLKISIHYSWRRMRIMTKNKSNIVRKIDSDYYLSDLAMKASFDKWWNSSLSIKDYFKYKAKWYHRARAKVLCFFKGHNWSIIERHKVVMDKEIGHYLANDGYYKWCNRCSKMEKRGD